jgi:hypothetical protein
MEGRVPTRSRAEGVAGIIVGLLAFGANHWNLPTWVFVASLSLAGVLMLVAIFSLPSMSWRLARRPPNFQALISTVNPPNFVDEIHEAGHMLRHEGATEESVEEWIDRVFERLLPWNPAAAAEFHPFLLPETSDSYARRDYWYNHSAEGRALNLKHVLEGLGEADPPTATYDPVMQALKEHLDRLIEVIAPH